MESFIKSQNDKKRLLWDVRETGECSVGMTEPPHRHFSKLFKCSMLYFFFQFYRAKMIQNLRSPHTTDFLYKGETP